ncbi:MAG: hypothetical protein ACKOXB_13545 [Flavobacteriales bacterium]
MKIKIPYSVLFALCLMPAFLFARDKTTATNFFTMNAGISSSFITGASFYQHNQFMKTYEAELLGLGYKVNSSILPKTTFTMGIKYGVPFNDKIMIYTGLFYTPRGFTENFSISDKNGLVEKYKFEMEANYWDLHFGLKYKSENGITLGIGGMATYNVKDIVKIDRTIMNGSQEVKTSEEKLFVEYYLVQRNIFPAAPFINLGFEQRWWNIELETSYSTNIFLATEMEMNFVSVNLKSGFVLLWD